MENIEEIISLAKSLDQKVVNDAYLKDYTTFKIGGKADAFIEISSTEALKQLLSRLESLKLKYMVLGRGSNVLFDDKGFNGVILHLGSDFAKAESLGNTITAQSGASLMSVCKLALDNSLSGLEFAYGIPGTVGGTVFMNAGAYGGEIKNVLTSCEVIDRNGNIKTVFASDMELSYRHSIFQTNGDVILSATFTLDNTKERKEISSTMNELMSRRKEKQPLEFPNAGSTFKRPKGYFAGKLIEDSGLKGYTVGRAAVSDKHSGFVINLGGATFEDVTKVISDVQKKVLNDSGQTLECEVLIVRYE
ncbi:MAG: UDP-N-acetylmuramate dehydrogenase [Ruminococcus sp.]|nr:UDP-N-acetylmuramate dehydrogenase [Ruminococcus sp.]